MTSHKPLSQGISLHNHRISLLQCAIGPSSVLDVESFCAVVVWSSAQLPCDDIMAYEVRLYDPHSGKVVQHQVGGLSTHYIITDQDKIHVDLEEAYVQV